MWRKAAVLATLLILPAYVIGAALGSLKNQNNIHDSATICFSIGLQASLTGLDDFVLEPTGNLSSGQPGALYLGGDDFSLESNGQVRVLISDGRLTNGPYTLTPEYSFDTDVDTLVTSPDATHSDNHRLNARFQIRGISEQLSGDYSGTVTLTVTPAIGGLSGCGGTTHSYPSAEAWGTLMWEDLYPNAGDADYNDFVVHFRIMEEYGANNELEKITMDFVPAARGAGYNHSLAISLDGQIDKTKNIETDTTPVFLGEADVKVSYTNLNNMNTYTRHFSSDDNITIFDSTRVAMGDAFENVYANESYQDAHWMTHIEINVDSASATDINGLASGEFNYRPFLHVNNTNSDIDLFAVNQADGMISDDGYPFGLMVPDAIYWPSEQTSINSVYPYFTEYQQWLNGEIDSPSQEALEWYNYPSSDAGSDLLYHQTDPTLLP